MTICCLQQVCLPSSCCDKSRCGNLHISSFPKGYLVFSRDLSFPLIRVQATGMLLKSSNGPVNAEPANRMPFSNDPQCPGLSTLSINMVEFTHPATGECPSVLTLDLTVDDVTESEGSSHKVNSRSTYDEKICLEGTCLLYHFLVE